jgi:predicted lactoylglutathione lyase
MLTPYQHELIHRELDGENTPDESAEVRKLVETQPEALALMTSLEELDGMFRQLPERETPSRVKSLIHQAVLLNSGTAPNARRVQGAGQKVARWAVEQWSGVINLMGEFMLTKKVLIIGTTAVAVIAVIGQAVVGYQPSVFDAGTVGAGDGMSGVQQAGRYKAKTDDNVTLSNPEVSALFQNDQTLKLIQSDVFREAMRNDTFRKLQASDEFRQLLANDSYRKILANDSYRMILANDSYRMLLANESFRALLANDSYRKVLASASFRELMANESYRKIMANDSYRMLLANDSYRMLLANDSYRMLLANDTFARLMANDNFVRLMANDSFVRLMANDSYRMLLSNDSYRMLLANDSFRAIARSASLSEAFLAEAMRVAP